MPSEAAISCQGIGKTYRLFGHSGDRIKQALSFGRLRFHKEFTALQHVSFEIRRGETVGIIGRNGSGKSTLLQLICGILRPTHGALVVNGRISALLELGAGFNPEFTGRENVYFQGAVLGIARKEMDARLEEIVAFAGIGEFIDQPVRTYSSGMFVRLAFSVAVHVDPDILVVDEALGVGDAEFQERSISRMKAMQAQGVTILLVSHSIPVVRNFCQRVIWLDRGKLRQTGDATTVCLAYQLEVDNQLEAKADSPRPLMPTQRLHLSGREKTISIVNAAISSSDITVGSSLVVAVELRYSEACSQSIAFGLGVIIRNEAGRIVAVFNTLRDDISLMGQIPRLNLQLPHTNFVPGQYWISVNVCDSGALFSFDEHDRCLSFDVQNELSRQGLPRWEGEVACEHVWNW